MLTDIGVAQVFEEGNLSDGGARSAFLVLQSNFLEGHQVVCQPRFAFVDGGVRSLYKRDVRLIHPSSTNWELGRRTIERET